MIVILTLISIIMFPHFMSLSSAAEAGSLRQLQSALTSSANTVFAQAISQGVQNERDYWLDVSGGNTNDIKLHSGHPMVGNNCSQFIAGLEHWIDIDNFSACSDGETTSNYWRGITAGNSFHFMPLKYSSTADKCYVTFREATSNGDDGFAVGTALTSSLVTVELEGCDN